MEKEAGDGPSLKKTMSTMQSHRLISYHLKQCKLKILTALSWAHDTVSREQLTRRDPSNLTAFLILHPVPNLPNFRIAFTWKKGSLIRKI